MIDKEILNNIRFKEIKADSSGNWKNNSNEYFLILAIWDDYLITPSEGASDAHHVGTITDTDGNMIGYFNQVQYASAVVAGSLSDEVFQYGVSKSYNARIIPPHFTLGSFAYGYGVYISEDIFKMIILNGGGY